MLQSVQRVFRVVAPGFNNQLCSLFRCQGEDRQDTLAVNSLVVADHIDLGLKSTRYVDKRVRRTSMQSLRIRYRDLTR